MQSCFRHLKPPWELIRGGMYLQKGFVWLGLYARMYATRISKLSCHILKLLASYQTSMGTSTLALSAVYVSRNEKGNM